jgi:hypothetical protein
MEGLKKLALMQAQREDEDDAHAKVHTKREVEVTFSLDSTAVSHVASRLVSAPAGWPDFLTNADSRRPRTVLHFYLKSSDPNEVRRIRVKPRRNAMKILLESKHVISQGSFLAEKTETVYDDDLSLDSFQILVSRPGSVVSAFVKNQYRVFLSSKESMFKASLDQVIPFRPNAPMSVGKSTWHFELEEKANWDPGQFISSQYFRETFAPILHPLLVSKWAFARMGPPASVPVRSFEAMRLYVASIVDRAVDARLSLEHLSRAQNL